MKIKYIIMDTWEADYQIKGIMKKGLVSCLQDRRHVILARYGVNKTALKKLLAKHYND